MSEQPVAKAVFLSKANLLCPSNIRGDAYLTAARTMRQKPAHLLKPFSVYVLLVTAGVVGATADARSLHRAPKETQAAIVKPDAKIPIEQKRDPADIALDRKIKGICHGC